MTGDTRRSYGQGLAAAVGTAVAIAVLAALAVSPAVAGAATFSNGAFIVIDDGAQATPYPSSIAVSGLSGTVSKVTATLRLSHQHPDDVDVLLVGPGGGNVILLSDAGGSIGVPDATLAFDANSGTPVPNESAISSGTYFPSNWNFDGAGNPEPADSFPGVAGPYNSGSYASFSGTNPNGTWSLYVVDDTGNGQSGGISGWSLNITTQSADGGTSPGGGGTQTPTCEDGYTYYPALGCSTYSGSDYDDDLDPCERFDAPASCDEDEDDDCPPDGARRPPPPVRPRPSPDNEAEEARASACGAQSKGTFGTGSSLGLKVALKKGIPVTVRVPESSVEEDDGDGEDEEGGRRARSAASAGWSATVTLTYRAKKAKKSARKKGKKKQKPTVIGTGKVKNAKPKSGRITVLVKLSKRGKRLLKQELKGKKKLKLGAKAKLAGPKIDGFRQKTTLTGSLTLKR